MEDFNKGLCVVLITSYNHEKFISKAIESVLNQTYKNIKLVIIDDCSKDNSRDIILRYKRRYPEKVDFIFNEFNLHINRSINRALEFIKNKYNPEYYASLASDDMYFLNKIEEQISFLEKYKYIDAVSSRGIYIDENDNEIGEIPLDKFFNKDIYKHEDVENYKRFFFTNVSGGTLVQSMLFKFNSIYSVKWDETSLVDDFNFMVRFLNKGYKIGFINKILWKYRIHGKNLHKNFDYTFHMWDTINRYIPEKYKNEITFKLLFLTGIYNLFYHKKRKEGFKFLWMSLAYLDKQGIKFLISKLPKGLKWLKKINR